MTSDWKTTVVGLCAGGLILWANHTSHHARWHYDALATIAALAGIRARDHVFDGMKEPEKLVRQIEFVSIPEPPHKRKI